jgi:hypothetical protein
LGFLARAAISGTAASIASALAAAICSRIENRHAARPMNAVAHIQDGGHPPARNRRGRNTAVGFVIHTVASLWWALFLESVPRRQRGALAASAVAAMAYVVDYHVVHRRLRPGFEAHLSPASLFAIYASLAAGFALAAALNRGFDDHEEENRDKGDERRPAERRPQAVVAPEALRQRLA